MIALRRTLAVPLYLLALIFDLLCRFFSSAAEYVAGDNDRPRSLKLPLLVIALLSVPLGVAHLANLATQSEQAGPARYEFVPPSDLSGVKVTYSQEELSRILPYLTLTACLFTEKALRYHLHPAKVSFSPCTHQSDFKIAFSDDLIDFTVIGVAEVDGEKKPFKAILQHYPTATEENGYRAISLIFEPLL